MKTPHVYLYIGRKPILRNSVLICRSSGSPFASSLSYFCDAAAVLVLIHHRKTLQVTNMPTYVITGKPNNPKSTQCLSQNTDITRRRQPRSRPRVCPPAFPIAKQHHPRLRPLLLRRPNRSQIRRLPLHPNPHLRHRLPRLHPLFRQRSRKSPQRLQNRLPDQQRRRQLSPRPNLPLDRQLRP
jgi:hypothetical protein